MFRAFYIGGLIVALLFVLNVTPVLSQTVAPAFENDLELHNLGSEFIVGPSFITQMAFTDGPSDETQYLYFSSNRSGIRRVTYNRETNRFVDGTLEDIATDINGLGIAFHGDVLYAAEGYKSRLSDDVDLSRIWKIEDNGLGTRTAIVEGIPRQDHGVNHIQIKGDSLYVGIGVRTRDGAFQTWNGDTHGESAYGGTITVIDDLTQVASEPNSAGFFSANPGLKEYRELINGDDDRAHLPFTTQAPNKLRVLAAGTRNPFGLAIDGEGQVWTTVNFHRTENHVYDRSNINGADGDGFGGDGFQDDIHDQMFPVKPKADYGYRNSNWQPGNAKGNQEAIDSGFFQDNKREASFTFDNYKDPVAVGDNDDQHPAYNQDHDVENPVGLGPSSSSNGFDFYQGNSFPLGLHQDAFVARWNATIEDGDDSLTFRDIVSVDMQTAEVRRVASGFKNPLDVVADDSGNLLMADYRGSIWLIQAKNQDERIHQFSWDSDASGAWSDRLNWNADTLSEADRLTPNQWGTARYAVTIDRENAMPNVRLDQNATIDSLNLGATLSIADAALEIQSGLTVMQDGILHIEAAAPNQAPKIVVDETAAIEGLIQATLSSVEDFPRDANTEVQLIAAKTFTNEAIVAELNGVMIDELGRQHVGSGLFAALDLVPSGLEQNTISAFVYAALPGDVDGDMHFNSGDLVAVFGLGEYEDGVVGNSNWIGGDWNGDSEFDTSDLVLAFQVGHYSVDSVASVPEPDGVLIVLTLFSLMVTSVAADSRRMTFRSLLGG